MSRQRLSQSMSSAAGRAVGLAAAGVAVAVLAGCATAPVSYLYDRQVYYKATLNRYPVSIVTIDGSSPSIRPQPVTMGEHVVVLAAQPVAGFFEPLRKTYPLTIAPCTRYYLAAQRQSPLLQDWDLVVEQTWPSGGCDPAKELAKARAAAAAGQQPPLTSTVEALTAPASPQGGPGDPVARPTAIGSIP